VDDDCDGGTDEGLAGCCECGDGKCQPFCESPLTCCPDCHECGNGVCECGESFTNCEADCCGECGDGKCARYRSGGKDYCGEDETACPADCHPAACGNGTCEPGESVQQCAADCKAGECGNHVCEPVDGGPAACPEDCAATCGNCFCEGTESSDTCPGDCGSCGDGVCSDCAALVEDLGTCPRDCCVPDPDGEWCGNHDDDDCDGEADEDGAAGCAWRYRDADGDGWGFTPDLRCLCDPGAPYTAEVPGDCDDAEPAANPGAVESCNGRDDDCDGVTDGDGSSGCDELWRDEDGDGYGVAGDSRCLCSPSQPYVATKPGDCADNEAAVNPGALEQCNGRDDDCDGAADGEGTAGCTEWWRDQDSDGWGLAGDSRCLCSPSLPYVATKPGDCADNEAAVNPGALEQCNGRDDDCDGAADEDQGMCPGSTPDGCVEAKCAGAAGCQVVYRDGRKCGAAGYCHKGSCGGPVVDNDDGTVRFYAYKFISLKTISGWGSAAAFISYCDALVFGGRDDWEAGCHWEINSYSTNCPSISTTPSCHLKCQTPLVISGTSWCWAWYGTHGACLNDYCSGGATGCSWYPLHCFVDMSSEWTD
jgi:hypothetical protein